MSTPVFDQRDASAFFSDALSLARLYCPEWSVPADGAVTADSVAQDPGLALVKLFSLLGNDLANVLNAIPGQRQLALYRFLDMGLRPAACARVPVRFSLAQQQPCVFLPKGTVIVDSSTPRTSFETDRDVQVLPAVLRAALTVAPRLDCYCDVQSLWAAGEVAPAFPGDAAPSNEQRFAHCLLLGDAALFGPGSPASQMTIAISGERLDPDYFQRWYDGALNVLPVTVSGTADQRFCSISFPVMPTADARPVAALHAAISMQAGRSLDTSDPSLASYPPAPLNWLVCEGVEAARVIPALRGYLPRIDTIRCDFGNLSTMPQQASVNARPLDLRNGALAFGATPAINDSFNIRCDAAFSQPSASIALSIDVAALTPAPTAQLEWQYWNDGWYPLSDTRNGNLYQFVDGTQNLAASGTVSFICPRMTQTSVAGSAGIWIRAVLCEGDYGDSKSGYRPPFVRSLVICYPSGGVPSAVYAHNAFALDELLAAPYEPYRPPADEGAALYLAFEPTGLLAYGLGQRLTLYVDIDPADEQTGYGDPGQWQWFDASRDEWQALAIDVAETGLARSASVSFTVPAQLQQTVLFSQTACWFRILCPHRRHALRLRGAYPNAVTASNRITYRSEVLGSSNGQPGQRFQLNHVSADASVANQVLLAVSDDPQYAVQIEVVEPANPDSVALSTSQAQPTAAYAWKRVDSFIGRGPNERVFMVDVISGAIVFGDGRHGGIPPAGTGNVIATCYATTRGSAGNIAAGALTALYVSTPGITDATNPTAARGGANADSVLDMSSNGPALVRANNRAVTGADVEALARAANAAVCRVRAIEHAVAPQFKLTGDTPFAPPLTEAGNGLSGPRDGPYLELVVLAASSDPRPLTPMSVLDDVLAYVRARSTPGLARRMTARRPTFKAIDVAVLLQTSAPKAQWAMLETTIVGQLTRYLHPAQGGTAGRGWPIGEPLKYAAVHAFFLALGNPVTAVQALALSGQTSDVPLAPYAVPCAGAIDVRFEQAPQP